MPNILLEIIVQNFHDNNLFSVFPFFLFFGLIRFVLYYVGSYCIFKRAKYFVCACLCFEGEGDFRTSY